MGNFSTKVDRVVDCHVHLRDLDELGQLKRIRIRAGMDRMNVVCIVDPPSGRGTASGLCAKLAAPGAFYVFGGLNHAESVSAGQASAGALAEQLDAMLAAGCDGVKLIEGKPTSRQKLPQPLDGDYYSEFFARAERRRAPMLWHVADPEEFWDPARTPAWAAKHNWGYGPDDVAKETLYEEVAAVLRRHPGLRVILAHFYFLSADLPRAEAFLAENPNARIDLAPGVEMLFNLSRDPAAAREFFIAHQDRIVFGTDISSSVSIASAMARAELVRLWLESEEPFAVPAEADELLEPGGDARIVPLNLPADVLAKIYAGNFEAVAGDAPAAVDVPQAIELCRRDAAVAAALSGTDADSTEPGHCAAILLDYPR